MEETKFIPKISLEIFLRRLISCILFLFISEIILAEILIYTIRWCITKKSFPDPYMFEFIKRMW